jgi:hypothetical protein
VSTLQINLYKKALLNGPSIILMPLRAISLGNVTEALLWQQLHYMSKPKDSAPFPSVTISYTRLQKQLPFYSRRWIIEAAAKLEKRGAVEIIRTGRVNKFIVRDDYDWGDMSYATIANMLVFPELACHIGLLEALVLQQVHIRHHDRDGSWWFRRPLSQWQSDTFMFLSLSTVKRVFASLEKSGLLLVKPYASDTGKMNSYRVSYMRLAELLEVEIPEVEVLCPKDYPNWVNPLHPI